MLKSDEQAQSVDILDAPKPSADGGPGAPKPTGEAGLASPKPSGGGGRLPSADRSLTVTPLDLRKARFGAAMRGFDRAEVTTLLVEAADGYEQALRENDRLRQEVARLESSLIQYRDLEGSLKSTLLIAQKTAEDVRENAAQEAARIVREAEGRAELLMEKAQARMDDVQRAIDALRMKRREAESNLESLVAAIRNTITSIHEQEQRELPKAVGHHLQVVR
jgi:cell division initiation protein